MRLSSSAMATAVAVWLAIAGIAAGSTDLRLIEAIRDRDHEAVRTLLAHEIDVNAREGDGATALHWAVVRDDVEVVDALLGAGADVDAANDYGVTPLTLACTNRNAAVVGRLLEAGANPDLATSMGETPLMTCARTGAADGLEALLDHGVGNVDARETSHGQTALMWAAAQENPDAVRVLLAHGADAGARSDSHLLPVSLGDGNPFEQYFLEPQRGSTPLLFAARNGRVENARLLLDAGADVDEAAPNGQSALVIASFSGQGELAELLLKRGANPNDAEAGYTALHTAVSRGDLNLVRALSAHGADPNARLERGSRQQRNLNWYGLSGALAGATPFWLAAKYAEVEIMEFLAEVGADPLLAPYGNGITPLMAAAGAGWTTRSSNRRDQGIGVDAARLLVLAGERATWEGTRLALELGSDVNAMDFNGNTALHAAVRLAYPTVVDLLVDHGGDLDLQNNNGTSARDLMCRDAAGNLVRPLAGGRSCPGSAP
ncbi:MAG: ankyrin repeat domain-containing protein [Acidobacteria bacterium]|nr:ankyrin repeat domain-containing protein [Acidobacteriota bacterium]